MVDFDIIGAGKELELKARETEAKKSRDQKVSQYTSELE